MLMLRRNQAWRVLQTGSVWKEKVDTLYLNNTKFAINNMQ